MYNQMNNIVILIDDIVYNFYAIKHVFSVDLRILYDTKNSNINL